MHAVIVPWVSTSLDPNPSHAPMLPPSLNPPGVPNPFAWGQASDLFESDGRVGLWVRASSLELDAIAAQPNSKVLGRCCSDAEAQAVFSSLSVASPKWTEQRDTYLEMRGILSKYRPGDSVSLSDQTAYRELRMRYADTSKRVHAYHNSAIRDCVAGYREAFAAEETAHRRQRAILFAVKVAVTLGLGVAVVWLAKYLGIPESAALALVPVHADNFNRSNGNINGQTMSDGLGAWVVDRATIQVESNQCGFNDNNYARGYDSVMAEEGVQEVFCTLIASPSGVITRRTAGNANYFGWWPGGSTLLKENAGGSDNQLGSSGSNMATGEQMHLLSSGDDHTLRVNGVIKVGPVTDTSKPVGRAGLIGSGTSPPPTTLGLSDDWRVDLDLAVGHPAARRIGRTPYGIDGVRIY